MMPKRVSGLMPPRVRRSVKINRARLFEAAGSTRFSHPALSRLDEVVFPYLPPGQGVFLEVGANDGYSQSNTYWLERVHGWRGVLIEPLPSLYTICRRIRKNSCCVNFACVGPDGPESIEVVDLDLMSVSIGLQDPAEENRRLRGRSGHRMRVPARTMSTILDEVGESHIDFMSVDVEGAESHVLSGLDLARHSPGHLLVETDRPAAISGLLAGHMDFQAQLTHHDYLFVRR